MTICSVKELKRGKRKIDLTSPDGNAFVLLGYAKQYAKQLNRDFDDIRKCMTASDYDNLLKVFDEEFGEFINLYRQLVMTHFYTTEVDLDEMPIEVVIEFVENEGYRVIPHSGMKDLLNDLVDAKIRNSSDFDKLFSEYVYDTLGRIIP